MITKKILIPMAAVAVLTAGAVGVSQVSAASSSGSGQTLAQRISSAFGLDQSKVQSVIDQYRTDQQSQAETKYEQMLTDAVSQGKLTSAQKDAILTEHNKLGSELAAAQGKTGTDRRTALQQVRTEANTWSKQNNLPAHWLLGARTMRGMGLGGRHDAAGNGSAPSSSPSPSPSASTSPSA
ncbi:MAG TPA: hypothetical protein VGH44_03025 [Candidatus Saccharimonadia bacterium]